MDRNIRHPVVAGQFYPQDKKNLKQELERYFNDISLDGNSMGIVVPHAGYIYSGSIAALGFSKLMKADTFILLGPNHTGLGRLVAASKNNWITPLGEVKIDLELASNFGCSLIFDEAPHRNEHSIEVQLPFLQYLFGNDFKILPISMCLQDIGTARHLGTLIYNAIKSSGNKSIAIIASSDFTHFKDSETAKSDDLYIIEPILEMNVSKFYKRIAERNVTTCGYGAVATMMVALKLFDANARGNLLKYATSGEITGDNTSVVGYAAINVDSMQ